MVRMTYSPAFPDTPDFTADRRPAKPGARKRSSPGIPRTVYVVLLFLLTAVGFLVLPASADTTTYLIQAANNVYVSNYTIDPGSPLYRGYRDGNVLCHQRECKPKRHGQPCNLW